MTDLLDYLAIYKLDMPVSIIIVSLLGLLLRASLTLCNQSWASTYHHTMTYMLLPVVTFTITKAISGNIALSLGMVGALSIIRFRNPVKNSFELSMYFALITIGITGSVNLNYSIALSLFITLIITFSYILEKILKKKGKSLYSFSFAEGQNINTLELVTYKKFEYFSNTNFLINEISDNDLKIQIYKFASPNKIDIDNIKDKIKDMDQSDVKSVQTSYNYN